MKTINISNGNRLHSADNTTVLLIDDEEPILNALGTALTDEGYHCLQASAAEGALKLLDRTPEIDVIISDIRMPGMSGIELLKVIRERFAERAWLQVIFVTGHATLENTVAALRLDAVDFLYKPVRREQLLASLAKAMTKVHEYKHLSEKFSEGRDRLEQLTEEARQLANMLGSIQRIPLPSVSHNGPVQSKLADETDLPNKERMLELLRTRDIKTRYFTDQLFIDPAWHMLLDLMENHLLNRRVPVSALYIASGVSPATAARRLDEMEQAGLIKRMLDPNDGRRQFAHLSERSLELMMSYLSTLHKQVSIRSY